VSEQIAISRSKDKACAQLERISADPVLAVASSLGSGPRSAVIAPEDVEWVRRFQPCGPVSGSFSIDQQRELDARFFSEQAGIMHVAEPDGGKAGADPLELEDSPIVSQEDNHGWTFFPERAETNLTAAGFWQDEVCEFAAESFSHRSILWHAVLYVRHELALPE
jgi:hypothetical protein